MQKLIKLGTRKSLLAMTQSTWIKEQIETHYPKTTVELIKIVTKGDKILDVPLAKVGGKGLFVKELEEAMICNEVDIAVHSMKDVPSELPPELHIGIITARENPFDAFVSIKYSSLVDLPVGAKVGTSSLRRQSQLARIRPDLLIDDLRGNVDTRLRKLDEGQYDAVVLASAGLNRLKLSHRITSCFRVEEMLPAVAQGAVGIELRKNDQSLLNDLSFLNHEKTMIAVTAERSFLKRLEGGCQVPIAGFATIKHDKLTITGLISAVNGTKFVKKSITGMTYDALSLGNTLAEELLSLGGREILAEVYNHREP